MPSAPVTPRGTGSRRKSFDEYVKTFAKRYKIAYKKVYTKEMGVVLDDVIQHTPIDTGASAGVLDNEVGSEKRAIYKGHVAFGQNIGNEPGDSGWQMVEKETNDGFKLSIVNPQWNKYLKYVHAGIIPPLPPASPGWVFRAWKRHDYRRDALRKAVKREL